MVKNITLFYIPLAICVVRFERTEKNGIFFDVYFWKYHEKNKYVNYYRSKCIEFLSIYFRTIPIFHKAVNLETTTTHGLYISYKMRSV